MAGRAPPGGQGLALAGLWPGPTLEGSVCETVPGAE